MLPQWNFRWPSLPITFFFIGSQFNHFAKSGTWNYSTPFRKIAEPPSGESFLHSLNGKPSLADDSTGMYSGFGFIVFFVAMVVDFNS
jgi:hypothetical protein